MRRIESSAKNFLLPRTVFEDLGFRYFGPVDGHDVNLLVNTLERIKDLSGPVVLHAVTKKGKGIDYAEQDPIKYHGVKAKKIGEDKTPVQTVPIFQNVFLKPWLSIGQSNFSIYF